MMKITKKLNMSMKDHQDYIDYELKMMMMKMKMMMMKMMMMKMMTKMMMKMKMMKMQIKACYP